MSSYVVSDTTILAVARGLELRGFSPEFREKTANVLKEMNEIAVSARYGENQKKTTVDMRQDRKFATTEILGSCRCYLYQVCDNDTLSGSIIYTEVEQLADDLEKEIARFGYRKSEIPWGLEDAALPTKPAKRINHRTRLAERCRR